MPKIAVLLATVTHPVSGRRMRNGLSAKAAEMALRIPGAQITGIHLGDAADPGLREFLGMGLQSIRVLELRNEQDPVVAAAHELQAIAPDLILAGGPDVGSGMLPYRISKSLGWPLIAEASEVAFVDMNWQVMCSVQSGWRRLARCGHAAVICAGHSAPEPRLPAYGKMARGIVTAGVARAPDRLPTPIEVRPAKRRGKLLQEPGGSGQSQLDKFMPSFGASTSSTSNRQLMASPSVSEAADAVLEWLEQRGLLTASTKGNSR